MRIVWMLLCLLTITETKRIETNYRKIDQKETERNYTRNTSVKLFREYIQTNTTSSGNLTEAVQFWRRLAASQNLSINVYEFVDGKPVVAIKWPGINSSLSSIMLNSHMDVVPAIASDGWTYSPFSGYLTQGGDIWGRGTQDMKSVSIQYFEALRSLKTKKIRLLRDVYMTLMPDEEIGGQSGMVPFLASEAFAAMNVGFELDEGTSMTYPYFLAFYQDKVSWQIQIDCYGTAAHGSTLPATNNTASGKCRNVMDTFLNFRDEQYVIAQHAPVTDASSYTSVNLNKLSGGTAKNVIPNRVSLTFDIRLNTKLNETAFQEQLEKWVADAGDNITITYLQKDSQSSATVINSTNPYWTVISEVAQELNVTLLPIIPPGTTDARFVRNAGIPAIGFSPMPNTPFLLHSVNEHLNAATFLRGIDVYKRLIQKLANLSARKVSTDSSVYVVKTSE